MPTPFPLQRLDNRDIPQIIALYERIDWRIHPDYLRWMIEWSNGGTFGITYRNKLLATALALPYGNQRGWVSMVVTDPTFQRRGMGRRITETAIEHLQRRGMAEIMLDASPMGRNLYLEMGFRPLYPVVTYRGLPALDETPDEPRIRLATDADFETLVKLDGAAYGVERPHVLKTIVNREGHQCWVDEVDGEVAGFLLVQRMHKGEAAFGPWVHRDPDGARRLFRVGAAGAGTQDDIRANAPEANAAAHSILVEMGMPRVAQNTRMIYGDVQPAGNPTTYYGIAAAALG